MLKKAVNNKYLIIIFIFIFISLVVTGAYAWLTWTSPNSTKMILTIGGKADVIFDEGNNINAVNLTPVFTPDDGERTTFSVIRNKESSDANIEYSVFLNVSSISEELKSDSFKYILRKNGVEVTSGNFSSATDDSIVNIYDDVLTIDKVDYEFIIYIDGNVENNTNIMNKKIIGTLNVAISE